LPFSADCFDGAIVSFGLRNLTDFDRGISEMARVVKSGGRVINLDLGASDIPGFSQLFSFYFSNVVPIIGELVQKDRSAYTYLPQSRSTYPKPDGISEIFKRANLVNIRHIPLALGTVALHIGTVK
jgi:demethylmenaquinone methyltransferase / 2-methoxy-6-polyprenyl-1,4-benzoquinol methylase